MNAKIAVCAVLALFFLAIRIGALPLARGGSELRCQCVSTHSQFIHPKHIQDVRLTQSGPHCKDVEIIATLRDGREVCLEPTAAWVKWIIKVILDKAEADTESQL